jgi:hypothetical protein
VGLWQDLEFRFNLPIVFAQDRRYRFARGTDEENSTIQNNCLQANGQLLDPNCPGTGSGAQPIFQVPQDTFRGGLGNLTFGLSYGIFRQEKDPTKPTWIVGLDYEAPTAAMLNPTEPTSRQERGAIGDRVHKYTFFTAVSRRMGIADPYFRIHYTLPVRGSGWYSNCDDPDASRMSVPENCNTRDWSRADTGIQAPHTGGVAFGTELNAYDNPAQQQKVAFDFRLRADYVSAGRYFNPLSDAMDKFLWTGDFMRLGGSMGFVAHAAEYVMLQVRAGLFYDTEHTLTGERVGKDLTGDGVVNVDFADPREINPNFDFRTDMVSRRFRATESVHLSIDATLTIRF